MAEPSGNLPGPAHAPRTTHACTSDKIDVKICRVRRYLQRGRSISSILRGIATRTQNVSKYMLVLALCLVINSVKVWQIVITFKFFSLGHAIKNAMNRSCCNWGSVSSVYALL